MASELQQPHARNRRVGRSTVGLVTAGALQSDSWGKADVKLTRRKSGGPMKTEFVSRSAIMILAIAVPLFAREAFGASWVEIASLPEPRWFLKAAAGEGGRVYAFGGWIEREGKGTKAKGFAQDALLIYDSVEKKWSAGPPAPFFRFPRLSRRTIGSGDETQYRWEPLERPGAHEPNLEGPIAAAGPGGRIFWFSKAGPIIFDTTRNAWDQPPGPVWKDSPEFRFVSGSVPHLDRINAEAATGPDGKIYILGGGTRARRGRRREAAPFVEHPGGL